MPFNWQTFKTRALSALVFVVVMMVGVLWNHWSFFVLFSIIHFGCWLEYQRLVEKIDPKYAEISAVHRYGVMLAGWGFMIWMTNEAYQVAGYRIADTGCWMLVVGFVVVNIETLIGRRGKLVAHSLMGLLYISLSLGLMIKLVDIPAKNEALNAEWKRHPEFWRDFAVLLPVFTVLCMWVNDTMAYLVGSLIGKTPFSKISPKKTWEGTVGGVLLCGIIMGFVAYSFDEWFVFNKPLIIWILLAVIAAVFGTLGDLFESKLKRLAGVKDSGHMMPGHGGFLDRFDSLLLATPFVWLYVWLVIGR
jgi:phosphatidate cytidylyltransferase